MSQAAVLAGPGFRRLFNAVRARLEREPDAPGHTTVSLRAPTDDERAAIGGLLGRRFHGATVTLRFADLDAALRAGPDQRDLRAWVAHVAGPLRDRPAETAAEAAAVAAVREQTRASQLAEAPWFAAWLQELTDTGALTRLVRERAAARLSDAVRVLEALPANDLPIALFASQVAGGTKSLDSTPLDRLVLGALAHRAGEPSPKGAEARRALWEKFGVVPDDLASQVLVLNLRPVGDGPVDQMLGVTADYGLPMRLTLHQLVRHPPTLASTGAFICENPTVLRAAAERFGPACAPLIATEGRPSVAFWSLLQRVVGPIRVHADFDAAGLEIVAAVLARHDATPWRFTAADYLAGRAKNIVLPSSLPNTPWDSSLRDAMAGGMRVEEEQVLDLLLADLAP